MAQWTYDAYGAVLTADHLHSHPPLHAGHKGLLVDRLDAPITDSSTAGETPRLVPLARVICQNRNRTYAPALGRFLQADPNATGAVLMQASAHHGRGMGALAAAFSMEDRYGDGLNVYEYLGSNPWGRSDVMGLWPSPADIAASAIMVGFRTLRGGLERLTEEYAGNMEHDIDWAMDWDMPDTWNSRGDNDWVGEAFRQGLWDGFREGFLEELDPLGIRDVVASGPAVARQTGGTNWNKVRKVVNSLGYVAHHAISFYPRTAARFKTLQRNYGIKFNLHSVDNMVALPKAVHRGRHKQVYHDNVFRFLEDYLDAGIASGRPAQEVFDEGMIKMRQSIQADPSRWFEQ